MRRILVTGMSGTGKSTALAELAQRGFRVVDTDDPPWSEWSEPDGGYVWREDLMTDLLAGDDGPSIAASLALLTAWAGVFTLAATRVIKRDVT